MAVTIDHLEIAVADLKKQQHKLSLDGAIAIGVISVYVQQQKEKQNGNNQ